MTDHIQNDPDIGKAMGEGYTLKQIINPMGIHRRCGARIGMAAYRYGPRSKQVRDAIDEANRVSVMLTSARAAYNRLMQEPKVRAVVDAPDRRLWRSNHPYYELIGPAHANREVVVDKQNDRRYKRFENGKLVEHLRLSDAEFDEMKVRG